MKIIFKFLKLLLNIIFSVIIIIGLTFVVFYIIGIEPFVVESGSMKPEIDTGSLCFINKLTKYEEIKVNDVIAFKLPTGVGVTHRVVEINEDGFTTKGDSNDEKDGIKTTKENYIGKNIFSIPKLGYGIKLIQTKRGKIILGTIILVIFLAGVLIGEPSKSKKRRMEEKRNKEKSINKTEEKIDVDTLDEQITNEENNEKITDDKDNNENTNNN